MGTANGVHPPCASAAKLKPSCERQSPGLGSVLKFRTLPNLARPIPHLDYNYNSRTTQKLGATNLQPERPIFIVGSPRSGTTLLRNMLNRHPAIAICGETFFQHAVYKRRRRFGDLSDLQNRERLVSQYISTRALRNMGIDLRTLRETLLQDGTSYPALFLSLLRFYARARNKVRYGEKTPQHAEFTETLCQWYPSAYVIHLVRDPRDTVASLLRMPWAPGSVIANARWWLRCNLSAWRSRHRPQYWQVRYEELVTCPVRELGKICAFIGEDYSPLMLEPNWDPATNRPWFRRAEEPVTTSRIGRWREELTADEAGLVEWVVGRHMQTFGCEALTRAPRVMAIAGGLAFAVVDAVRRRMAEFPAALYYLVRSPNLLREEAARQRSRQGHLRQSIDHRA